MKTTKIRRLAVVGLTVLAVLIAAGEARSGSTVIGRLYAKVGPVGRVSIRDAAGRRVTAIPAGSYVLTVRDTSKHQNFHLVGPTISKQTGIKFVGTVRWTLKLRAGIYRAHSDRAPSGLASFQVN
jgi:hypothetical protein